MPPWSEGARGGRHPIHGAAGGTRDGTYTARRRCSGFSYTLFLSRFYGFRVRAVQNSWFAVHARIACMTDGQSARFARTTPQHCVRSTRLLGSPAAIPRTSRLGLGGLCTVPGSFI
jgi:hypothetical protein